RREIKNLALVVEEEPSAELLAEMEIEPPDSLYGLYQGTPLTERTWGWGNALPDRITIYQRPIEEDCEDDDEMRAVIGETLIHEVGHYFGLSEEEIEEIEERYWRSETIDEDEEDAWGAAGASRAPADPEALRPAFSGTGLGGQARTRGPAVPRRHLPRDRSRPRRPDEAAGSPGRPNHRG